MSLGAVWTVQWTLYLLLEPQVQKGARQGRRYLGTVYGVTIRDKEGTKLQGQHTLTDTREPGKDLKCKTKYSTDTVGHGGAWPTRHPQTKTQNLGPGLRSRGVQDT